MSEWLGLLIAISIVVLASIIIILIFSKLKLGFEVTGFGDIIFLALATAILSGILTYLVSLFGLMDEGGLMGGIIHFLSSFIVLGTSGRFLTRITVTGFTGISLASMAIGAFYWLGGLTMGRLTV